MARAPGLFGRGPRPSSRGAAPARQLRVVGGLLVLGLTASGCTPLDNAMVSIFGRGMRDQSSIGSYEDPRTPPEGAVPFAAGNFPSGPGVVNLGQPEGTAVPPPITAAQVLQALGNPDGFPEVTALENPVEPSAASLARGQQVYDRACAPCHGLTGAGEGPVGQVAGVFARSLLVPETIALTDGYIYSIIRVGRGAMPQYGHQITHFDRWHVVNYVRQLQGM